MSPGFTDTEKQREFILNGYTTVPILDANEIDDLKSFFIDNQNTIQDGFYASLFDTNYSLKEKIDIKVRGILEPRISAILNAYKGVIGSYVVKYNGDRGLVHPHQDWTFVDESRYASLNIWIPLQDVDEKNGALFLLPNSHNLPFAYRGTNIVSAIVGAAHVSLKEMNPILLKAGEALIYNHKMIHASPPNLSHSTRLAVAMVVIPQEADLIHVAKINDRFFKYKIDREFFYKHQCINDNNMVMPDGYLPEQEIDYKEFIFREKDLFTNLSLISKLRRKLHLV